MYISGLYMNAYSTNVCDCWRHWC